jgi:hypothetical protein
MSQPLPSRRHFLVGLLLPFLAWRRPTRPAAAVPALPPVPAPLPRVLDALPSNVTTFTYDSAGCLTRVTFSPPRCSWPPLADCDPAGPGTAYSYDRPAGPITPPDAPGHSG